MSYEQKDFTGALFKNQKKKTEKHPDYTGQAKIGGTEYWVSSWIKEGDKGKWMSLAFTRKDERKAGPF